MRASVIEDCHDDDRIRAWKGQIRDAAVGDTDRTVCGWADSFSTCVNGDCGSAAASTEWIAVVPVYE